MISGYPISSSEGEYRCPEVFDGSKLIAYRLTIEPCTRAMRD
jgi:hypothetical protein